MTFCNFQGTVATPYGLGGQFRNLLVWNFLKIPLPNILNQFIFDRVIQETVGWRFLDHGVYKRWSRQLTVITPLHADDTQASYTICVHLHDCRDLRLIVTLITR